MEIIIYLGFADRLNQLLRCMMPIGHVRWMIRFRNSKAVWFTA
jgi:hypothetical protein